MANACKVDNPRLLSNSAPACTVRYNGQRKGYPEDRRKEENRDAEGKGEAVMRGYFTANGYYGLVNGYYRLFASESDYYELMSEDAA